MEYVIYIDVFFLVNFIMDFLLLKASSCYIKPRATNVRCLLGGAVGSLITCVSILWVFDNMILHMLISYIFTVVIMVMITYGKATFTQVVRRVGALYLVTVTTGGIMNIIYDYTYFGYMLHGMFSAVYDNPLNIIILISIAGVSYVIMTIVIKLVSRKGKHYQYVRVVLSVKGRTVDVKGLIDSGNSLMDPYYRKPIHVVTYSVVQKVLEGVDIHKEKYRLVPFASLGKENGLLEVVEIDSIVVYGAEDNETKEMYRELQPAIGIYHGTLSGKNEFNILLHKDVEDNWR